MKKVIIVGPSGSGKSTLAENISTLIGCDFLELDSVNHQANWQPLDKREFRRRVSEFMNSDSWVVDGNYFSTLGIEFWKRADTIIWIDLPLSIVLSRLVKRTLKRTIGRTVLWNGNKESFFGNFFTTDSVIYFMLKKWRSQRKKYENLFGELGGVEEVRLVRLKTTRQVREFLQYIH